MEREEGKNALLDAIEISIEVEIEVSIPSPIKIKEEKKVELEGKITAENSKLAVDKKEEKTGIEGGAMSKTKDEGKDNPEVKYEYIEEFSVRDQPLKEAASRNRCASNQLAEAKVEREDKL